MPYPYSIRWPGKVAKGSKSDHVSAFWDMIPTFAEITGAEPPENIDGISFLPELLGETDKQKKHDYLYWEFHEQEGKQAVRWGNWKGLRLDVHKKGFHDEIELFWVQLPQVFRLFTEWDTYTLIILYTLIPTESAAWGCSPQALSLNPNLVL